MAKWWEMYAARLPEGANLVASKVTPGLVRGFYRGLNGIKGHGEFVKLDLRGPVVIYGAVMLAAGIFGTLEVQKNAPRLKRWWSNTALPTVQSAINAILRRDPMHHEAGTAMLSKEALQDFSNEIDVALENTRVNLTSAEVQQHLIEILMAASIIADRMRALANAHLEDEGLPELASALDKLSAKDVTDTINHMLESNPSLLDDETTTIFSKVFGGGHVDEGAFIPLSNEGVKDALSLPGREIALPLEEDSRDEPFEDEDSAPPS